MRHISILNAQAFQQKGRAELKDGLSNYSVAVARSAGRRWGCAQQSFAAIVVLAGASETRALLSAASADRCVRWILHVSRRAGGPAVVGVYLD